MNAEKYTVVGGDLRSVKLANLLKSDMKKVNIFGFKNAAFDTGIEEDASLSNAIDDSDIVIGPLPCSNDNETLNAPFYPGRIYINEIFNLMKKSQLFIAGRMNDKIIQLASAHGIKCIDLLEREEMAVLNAIPTAEGAIQIAMEEMPITLHDCKALILGYGRIGKILAKMLQGIGVKVFIEARKFHDLAWVRSYGYTPVSLSELSGYIGNADVIFNTIPHILLDEKMLSLIKPECLIIDLASKPGGVDFEKAKTMGLKVIWALSLPGKVAPITAARFIKDTIYNIVEESGV